MTSEKYCIVLSSDGDLLSFVDFDTWKATFDFSQAIIFESYGEANFYLDEFDIRLVWPEAKIKLV